MDPGVVATTAASRPERKRSGSEAPLVNDIIEDHTFAKSMSHVKRYRKGRFLGQGGFAECHELISCDSARVYAAKIINKRTIQKHSVKANLLLNEIKIHRSLSHPNIVRFERFFEDHLNVYILLELCPQRTLLEMVHARKRLTEVEVQRFMWQLVNGVEYLHEQCVIHRDLKLGNMFLDDVSAAFALCLPTSLCSANTVASAHSICKLFQFGLHCLFAYCATLTRIQIAISQNLEIKIGDFGLATRLAHPDERKRTMCGTPNYMAPELVDGKNTSGHSYEVDVWSMGVIMYTLLFGK